jgi:Leucine-rich repeat (LRR) protein
MHVNRHNPFGNVPVSSPTTNAPGADAAQQQGAEQPPSVVIAPPVRPMSSRFPSSRMNRDRGDRLANTPSPPASIVRAGGAPSAAERLETPSGSRSAGPLTRMRERARLHAEWDAWAKAEHANTGKDGAFEAVRRMKACTKSFQAEKELILSNLGLTSVPSRWPPKIKVLHVGGNALAEVPPWAHLENLTYIHVDDNELTELPELPSGLEILSARKNKLESLPPLPDGLNTLEVDNNKLESLPPPPDGLKTLYVGTNKLESLPQLGTGLLWIDANDNNLRDFPNLPSGIRRVRLENNRLSEVPRSVWDMRGADIYLKGNPLDDEVRTSIEQMMSLVASLPAGTYMGPQIEIGRVEDQAILPSYVKPPEYAEVEPPVYAADLPEGHRTIPTREIQVDVSAVNPDTKG